jgi:sugar-specific transcriptional regulator TrmB
MDLGALERIGLSRAEVKVYTTLLGLGSAPSARIVQETALRKSTVYDSIRRLQEKGLVSSVIKDSRKYFEATGPDRLLEFLNDKRSVLDEHEKEVRELIPKLKEIFPESKPRAEAHILVGVEGYKTMRRDVLRNAVKELLLLGAVAKEHEAVPKFYVNWNTSRILKGIRTRVLAKESTRKRALVIKGIAGEGYDVRFLPEEFESPALINIYGDRVVDVLWKGSEPLCFMLINKDIADAYRQYFNYLWKIARK